MLAAFRRSLDTWAVRGLFLVLLAAFVFWGIGDVVRNVGRGGYAAKVAGRTIPPEELQEAYKRQLDQTVRSLGGKIEPTPEIRRAVLGQTLQRLVIQASLAAEEARLGITVPSAALQQAVLDIPQFRGPDGRYDPAVARQVLQQNGLTEGRLSQLIREEVGNRQLLDAVRAGAAAPETLTRIVFAFQQEKRSAETAEFPFAAATVPDPTDAELHRWYDNHPDLYSTPEYRRIKAVVLSPETIAKDVTVTDEEVRAAYDQHASEFSKPERRNVQVVLSQDEAKARALADEWRKGADWARIQQAAKDAGATAVELPSSTRAELPDPVLAAAAFGAERDVVSDVQKGQFGWDAFRVTAIAPAETRDFDSVRDELRGKIAAERAGSLLYDRANQLDQVFGGGGDMDHIPTDVGAAGFLGTVDKSGQGQEGQQAPIPGTPALRTALLAAAFAAHPGDPPKLLDVGGEQGAATSYYAVSVESIIPPAPRGFEEVESAVRDDWTHDARRHAEEQAAARMLSAIQGGQSFEDAATVAGVTTRRTPLTTRAQAAEGFPPALLEPLFSLKTGEPTMIEQGEAFIVALPAETVAADPAADKVTYDAMRAQVQGAIAADVEAAYETALRARADVRVNEQVVGAMVQ